MSSHHPARSRIPEVLIGLGVPFGLLVALDWAWLRQGESVGLEIASKLTWTTAGILTPVIFWRLVRRSLPGLEGPWSWALQAVLTGVCSLAWFYLAYTVLVNLHLAMGGSL